MLRRSRTHRLMLFGLAVALAAHVWMLHDPMPAASSVEDRPAPASWTSSPVMGAAESGPRPSGDEQGPGMPFMALTCLAVVAGAAVGGVAAGWWRGRTIVRGAAPGWSMTLARHRPGRPPPVPLPSRVDAGVLLLV